jgi:uncharacterized DUF497 family protein
VFEDLDWTHRGEYIYAKHGVTIAAANSAVRDPERVAIEPDYNSESGRTVRIIGYSTVLDDVLTVIALRGENGVEYGVNCWVSNVKDRRIYREGG